MKGKVSVSLYVNLSVRYSQHENLRMFLPIYDMFKVHGYYIRCTETGYPEIFSSLLHRLEVAMKKSGVQSQCPRKFAYSQYIGQSRIFSNGPTALL